MQVPTLFVSNDLNSIMWVMNEEQANEALANGLREATKEEQETIWAETMADTQHFLQPD